MAVDNTPSTVLQDLQQALKQYPVPPVDSWHPATTRESRMRIARNGDWYYQESKIERQRMVRLFASILRRDHDDYFLVTPAEKLRIDVEDAPFVAVLLRVENDDGQQKLIFTNNMGDETIADSDHPIFVEYTQAEADPSPYIVVRKGLSALMSRAVYYQLAELVETHQGKLGVYSCGCFMDMAEAG